MKASGVGEIISESLNNEVGVQCIQSTVPNTHDMEAISASFGLKKKDMHDNVHETERFLFRNISQILKDRYCIFTYLWNLKQTNKQK